ncbi:MAG: tyrosine-type recombinase/integrase [Limnochordia bacterium]
MAEPYKRKDGRWACDVWVTTNSGEQKRKTIYGKNEREVKQKVTLFNADVARNGYVKSSPLTTGQFLTEWAENLASVRLNTKNSYRNNIRLHVTPHIGHIKLQRLTPLDIQNLLSTLEKKELSPRTCQYVYSILRKGLKQALKWGLITFNPSDGVDRPLVPKHQIKPLSTEQAKLFLQTAKRLEDPYYALFVLAISTGMRSGELLGLQWEDVDFVNARLSVRHTLITSTKTLAEPKTAKSRRVIELSDIAVSALKQHRRDQAEERLINPDWETTYNLVFSTRNGTPLDHSHLTQRHFHRILDEAGLPRIRFHDLRHSAATLLLQAGEHPKIVQEILGHSTIAMTLDTYSHVTPSMQKEAAKKMHDLLQESRGHYVDIPPSWSHLCPTEIHILAG